MDFILHSREAVKDLMLETGFEIRFDLERAPEADEVATRRGYLWVEKPAGAEDKKTG